MEKFPENFRKLGFQNFHFLKKLVFFFVNRIYTWKLGILLEISPIFQKIPTLDKNFVNNYLCSGFQGDEKGRPLEIEIFC